MNTLHRFGDWLCDAATPRFGQVSTWILLSFAVVVALIPIEFDVGQRSPDSSSLFSALPVSVLTSPLLFTAVRIVLLVSALLWAAGKFIPVSCWVTVFTFTLMWSLRMENLTNGAHIFNVTNMLLVIHAMWFHFRATEIRTAIHCGNFWQTPLYPRWVFFLSVFYLGWFHTLAGITKIATSGFGWGNGLSLQIWTAMFGWPPSPFGQVLLFDTRLTALMQSGALALECASILCIVGRRFRYAIGLGLTGFYIGVLTTFVDFGFHFNAILVAWFLLPVDAWMRLRFNDRIE